MKLDNISLVIIPHWLEETLSANKLEKAALVDLFALSRIVSKHDLCFYVAINTTLFEKIHEPLRDSFERSNFFMDNNGRMTITQQDGSRPNVEEVRKLYEELDKDLYGYNRSNLEVVYPQANSVLAALPYLNKNDQNQPEDEKIDEAYLFELFEIRERILGVRFKRPVTDISFEEQLWGCYDRALEMLHVYADEHDIAKTALFNAFATLCRQVPLHV